MLPPMPSASPTMEHTPADWQRIIGVQVLDPDGWRDGSIFGAKDWNAPVTRAEFLQRAGLSTVKWS